MAILQSSAAVFPVSDLERAVKHYELLGFRVTTYAGEEAYAYARRDHINLHFWEFDELDPLKNFSSVFVYVDDADRLAEEWQNATSTLEYECPTMLPQNTEYNLREGAHVDADGNLIRFAHSLEAD
ncbi:bleomycin resistance protein [Neomicrococcus lactis]|uniref:bleomycin resistance protein n=1 Tax=Neomicrococcus lactis TaxID=732241 RepID=UPI002301303F|nr:VOC family protein [Neomicrococcus lactis]